MRAVLVGADLMYRKDGSLVPIEINTNTAIDVCNRVEPYSEICNIDKLVDFIKSRNIKTVYFEGASQFLARELRDRVRDIVVLQQSRGEDIEDSDQILTVRASYSDEAVVDSFCRDKVTFLKALQSTKFGCEYLYKELDEVEGKITIFENYPEGIPNFILKCRYPYYDKAKYPKLLRFDTEEDLLEFAESDEMPEDFLIMPYYFCEDRLFDGERIQLFRELSIFISEEGNLVSIPVGRYTKVCSKLDYSDSRSLDDRRDMFLTTGLSEARQAEAALLEKGDLVWMSDGSWKPVEEVKEGDLVKSLEIPAKEGYNAAMHVGDYGIGLDELEAETSFVNNEVCRIEKISRITDLIHITFNDKSDWWDTPDSSYPVLNSKGTVEFKTLKTIGIGESVILLSLENTNAPEFAVKVVEDLNIQRQPIEDAYAIELDGSHLFISRTSEDGLAYAAIEHNENCPSHCNYACGSNQSEFYSSLSEAQDYAANGCPGDHPTWSCSVNTSKSQYGCYCVCP